MVGKAIGINQEIRVDLPEQEEDHVMMEREFLAGLRRDEKWPVNKLSFPMPSEALTRLNEDRERRFAEADKPTARK
jgi:hypothetical protein